MCTDVAMWFRSDGPLDADEVAETYVAPGARGIDAMTTATDTHLLVDRPEAGVVVVDAEPAREAQCAVEGAGRRPPAHLRGLGADGRTRCAVITGAPPAFCAGGDLSELRTADDEDYAAYCASYRSLALAIRDLPFPLIAAVERRGGGRRLRADVPRRHADRGRRRDLHDAATPTSVCPRRAASAGCCRASWASAGRWPL